MSRKPMADVLGQVYEQFLGKVIRLTAGHQAKVEQEPEATYPPAHLTYPARFCIMSAWNTNPRP